MALFPSSVLENILPGVKQFEYYFPVVFSPPWIPITHMLELLAVYGMSNTLSSKFHHFLSVIILNVFCGSVLQLQFYSFYPGLCPWAPLLPQPCVFTGAQHSKTVGKLSEKLFFFFFYLDF